MVHQHVVDEHELCEGVRDVGFPILSNSDLIYYRAHLSQRPFLDTSVHATLGAPIASREALGKVAKMPEYSDIPPFLLTSSPLLVLVFLVDHHDGRFHLEKFLSTSKSWRDEGREKIVAHADARTRFRLRGLDRSCRYGRPPQ